jgi:hypothetical protein
MYLCFGLATTTFHAMHFWQVFGPSQAILQGLKELLNVQVTAETETYTSALPMGWALRGPMENVIARQQQRSASGFLEMSRKICTAFAREQGRLSSDSVRLPLLAQHPTISRASFFH